jgi:hypothetical protein
MIGLTGCGGGGSSSTPPSSDTKTGYLIDSAVDGVEYVTSSGKSGTTSDGGKFEYEKDDTNISFSIGGLKLPDFNLSNLNGDKKILPTDLVGVDRNNTTDGNVSKVLQILQTLDEDGNATNGITITLTVRNAFGVNKNILDSNISDINTTLHTAGITNRTIVNPIKARAHFEKTLRDSFGFDLDTIAPDAPTLITDINSTDTNTTQITIQGEVGAKIFLNGNDTGYTIGLNGTQTLDINTISGGNHNIKIMLKDNKGNASSFFDKNITRVLPIFQSGETWKGLVYNTVTSPHTGRVWLDRNLGATMVCTESRDSGKFADDAAYVTSQQNCFGDYYQWGRNTDGHEKSTSNSVDANDSTLATDVITVGHGDFIISNSTYQYDWAKDGNNKLLIRGWSKTDGTSVCPVGYRVPFFGELRDETYGLSGFDNRSDAFESFLKLPSAGYRDYDSGSLEYRGSYGSLWSTSVGTLSGYYGRAEYSYFYSSNASHYDSYLTYGRSVRCIKD